MHVVYDTRFRFQVVRAALEGSTLDEINVQHGSTVSANSLRRWSQQYQETRSVVANPENYSVRGRPLALDAEEREFLSQIVTNNPTIYLTEIQQQLSDERNVRVSLQTISNELKIRLMLSCKTMRTVHPSQNVEDRLDYITLIAHYDPECLVFTGEFVSFVQIFLDSHSCFFFSR
jgi:transposase